MARSGVEAGLAFTTLALWGASGDMRTNPGHWEFLHQTPQGLDTISTLTALAGFALAAGLLLPHFSSFLSRRMRR